MRQIDFLKDALELGQSIFLLVDPIVGEPVVMPDIAQQGGLEAAMAERQSVWGRPVHPIRLSARVPLQPSLHPYLVEFNDMDDTWLGDSLEMALRESHPASLLDDTGLAYVGGRHSIGGWLQSARWPEDIAATLAEAMTLHLHAGIKKNYLRLADRRTLAWVAHVLGQARLQEALLPLTRWIYLDAAQRLTSLTIDQTMLNRQAGPTRLRLSLDEWRQIEQGSMHHGVLACWLHGTESKQGEQDEAIFNPWSQPLSASFEKISQTLIQARQNAARWSHWFQNDKDLAVCASLSLIHGEPALRHCLQTMAPGGPADAREGMGLHALRVEIGERIKEIKPYE